MFEKIIFIYETCGNCSRRIQISPSSFHNGIDDVPLSVEPKHVDPQLDPPARQSKQLLFRILTPARQRLLRCKNGIPKCFKRNVFTSTILHPDDEVRTQITGGTHFATAQLLLSFSNTSLQQT